MSSWAEEPADGLDGMSKVTVAHIGQRFSGGIEADTIFDAVMVYRDGGTAAFTGYQCVQGVIGDKAGSFVLHAIGSFDGDTARTDFEVVAGTATGDLAGLTGTGASAVSGGAPGTYCFDLNL